MTPLPPAPQRAASIPAPASQKAEIAHHLPPPCPAVAVPSLPGTEWPSSWQPHTYLPAHFSIAPPWMPGGRGQRTGSKHTTPASGR